jgi:DNA-binding MarR family transcriptional regulator
VRRATVGARATIPPVKKAGSDVLAAWSALLAAHRGLTTALDEQLRREVGISLDDYDVLYQVRSAGEPVRMTQLAERVLISRPTASRVVDRLVAKGWIHRWHDDGDRRVVLLELTDEGNRQQSRGGRVHLDGIARLVGNPLAGRDVAGLTAALRALAGAAPPIGAGGAEGAGGR